MICPSYPTPFLFFFSNQVPALLYYSHIPIIFASIFIGIFVIFKDKKSKLSIALAAPLFLFALWLFLDLITWTSNSSDNIMFTWSFFGILFIAINFFFLRFLYRFIDDKEVPFSVSFTIFLLSLPIIFLTPSIFNLSSFDTLLCSANEGSYFLNYYYLVGFLIFIYICFFAVKHYLSSDKSSKPKILLTGGGTILFLSFFFSTGVIVTVLRYFNIVKDYQIEQFGFFPIIIFIILLALTVIRYKIFNIKLLAVQALVFSLVFLIGSQFFFIKVTINFILNGITFIGVIISGKYLIKAVKKEIEQRERLEILTEQLFEANEKLKSLDKLKTEFVSLASHQLRSPLTAIKGYTSMLLEGDYGELNSEAKQTIDRVMQSSNNLTLVVEDLLNVSKIESGGMKYVMEKFDFGELARKTTEELSINAEKRGLKLFSTITEEQKYFINGDKEKIRQIVLNLIDNSIKYTKEGQIEVGMNTKEGKITMTIKDTGVGIEKGKEDALFEKFSRGDGAKINASGSGLGLYLVREIAKAHGGRVWALSEGAGKGSTFFVEFAEVK